MIVESIQRVYTLSPLARELAVVKTLTDPLTLKEYREIIVYRVYNSRAEIEESTQPKIDLRA